MELSDVEESLDEVQADHVDADTGSIRPRDDVNDPPCEGLKESKLEMKGTQTDDDMSSEDKKRMYKAVVSGDIDQLDDLLDLPNADINMTLYSESLLMAAIRADQKEMAEFLIDNGINHNYETVRINIRADSNVVEYYSYSTRQMAYDYGMADIVELIDELNGMKWPWSHRSPRTVRLKKTAAEKQAERKDADNDAIDCVAGANMDHVVGVDNVIDTGHVVGTVERMENSILGPVPAEKCVSFKLSDNVHAERCIVRLPDIHDIRYPISNAGSEEELSSEDKMNTREETRRKRNRQLMYVDTKTFLLRRKCSVDLIHRSNVPETETRSSSLWKKPKSGLVLRSGPYRVETNDGSILPTFRGTRPGSAKLRSLNPWKNDDPGILDTLSRRNSILNGLPSRNVSKTDRLRRLSERRDSNVKEISMKREDAFRIDSTLSTRFGEMKVCDRKVRTWSGKPQYGIRQTLHSV